MTLRERILLLINSKDYQGMDKGELADFFELEEDDYELFFKSLYDMEKEGLIYLSKKDKYLPLNQIIEEGTIEGTNSGFAFFINDDPDKDDVFISPNALAGAIHGDRVRIKITKEAQNGNNAEGQVIKILSAIDAEIVGTFVQEGKYYFVEANNNKYSRDIFIPKKLKNKAKHNDKVVVRLTKRAKKDRNPEGRIVEILGNKYSHGVEVSSIAREFDLTRDFPDQVLEEVKDIPDQVTYEDLHGREDFSSLFTVTIDGADAKDFDDAISIEKEEDGSYRLYVHIADVAHYVKDRTDLDKEALKRGNSVYLLDRVIPMLPEKISNGICSLQPGKTRLTHTVEMVIDQKARLRDYNFHISYIKSDHRLIYDDVSDFLEFDISMGDSYLEEKLQTMEELWQILHDKRIGRGALDFNIPESQIDIDKDGKVTDIYPRDRRIADSIIEEFMIVCNETVSEHFGHMEYPFIYRVHGEPSQERIDSFQEIIEPLGYKIRGKDIHAKDFQKLLKETEDRPEERLISTLLLRTMKKAKYSADHASHFGLASNFYSHFTAPIRRYADLAIHRIFKDTVRNNLKMDNTSDLYLYLSDISDHVSDTERMAEDAERQVEDYMKTEYMKELVGRRYDGIISSLTSYGIYVQLENTVEGLASFRNQRDDYYIFDEENYRVIGDHTGRQIKIGMEVKVVVIGVDEIRNEINFEIIEW